MCYVHAACRFAIADPLSIFQSSVELRVACSKIGWNSSSGKSSMQERRMLFVTDYR